MPSPIYQQYQPQDQMANTVERFKQNPLGMLAQRFNIPQGMSDPNQILQYLLNTNQITQEQVNRVMQMRNDPRIQQILR